MSRRYDGLFARMDEKGEGAFVPFVMLGDPTPTACRRLLRSIIDGGADALELGIPFSDPIADGPVIQAAAVRALAAGTTPDECWDIIAEVRSAEPELPMGLLVYGNLVLRPGIDRFYARAGAAGVDSVLVADLPLDEASPFEAAAAAHGVAPVFIAPPNAEPHRLAAIAGRSRGYTYVTSRSGVTGEDAGEHRDLAARMTTLRTLGAAPPVLGFGIARPAQVRSALDAGAAGVIAGSAIVRRVAEATDPGRLQVELTHFVRDMKEATRHS